MVDWEIFFGNSSVESALAEFVLGVSNFKQFSRGCWPADCKAAIKKLKARGYKKARRAAREAMHRRRIHPSDWMPML